MKSKSDTVITESDNIPPQRSAGRIIARNTVFGVGAQMALRVAGFIFTILVVRTLGEENFGQYSIILAWAGLFSVIGDLGVNQLLAREIARDKETAVQLFWDTVALRFILAIIAMVVTVGGAIILTDYPTDIVIGIAIFTSTYFLQSFIAPLQSLLVGNERVDVISVLNVVNQVGFMILAGLFLFVGFNFIWLVIASVLTLPLIGFIQIRVIRRNNLGPPRLQLNPSRWVSLIRGGLPFSAIQLSLSFAFQVDTIFLSSYTSSAVVGWYSAAYRLTLSFLTVSNTFNQSVLPTLAREHANNPATVRNWYHTAVRFILMIGLPVAVGGSILSSTVVVIFGDDFLPSAIAFAILIWDVPFVMYHSFCGNIATSIKHEASAARIYMSVGIFNVILNAILIPRFGIAAACFATVFTDMLGAAFFYVMLRHALGPGLQLKRLVLIVAAVTVMGIVVFLIRSQNIVLVVGIGAAIYGLLIWSLPTISANERQRIRHLGMQVSQHLHLV